MDNAVTQDLHNKEKLDLLIKDLIMDNAVTQDLHSKELDVIEIAQHRVGLDK